MATAVPVPCRSVATARWWWQAVGPLTVPVTSSPGPEEPQWRAVDAELHVEVVEGRVRGSLRTSGGRHDFDGWIGLVAVILAAAGHEAPPDLTPRFLPPHHEDR